MSARTLDDILNNGTQIGSIDYVSPGDLVFLENTRTGMFMGFTIARVEWDGQGRVMLWQTPVRNHMVGGASRLRFLYALRPVGQGDDDHEADE